MVVQSSLFECRITSDVMLGAPLTRIAVLTGVSGKANITLTKCMNFNIYNRPSNVNSWAKGTPGTSCTMRRLAKVSPVYHGLLWRAWLPLFLSEFEIPCTWTDIRIVWLPCNKWSKFSKNTHRPIVGPVGQVSLWNLNKIFYLIWRPCCACSFYWCSVTIK